MAGANRAKRSLLLLLLSSLFFGCSEGSLFVPDLSQEDTPELSTVAQGEILSAGGALPIALPEENGGDYTTLDITIRTPEGEVVYTTSYDGELLSEPVLPDLPLPDLEEGTYLVELLLFDQQLEVAREESLFFLTDKTISIQGITLYPPTSEPEAQLIAEAHISRSSPDIDPYLRWRLESTVLQEGVLSQDGATARVETDEEVGAFTLTLELFPWSPPSALTYEFRSPISHATDILVRPRGKNLPAEGYLVYGFNGHGRAQGELLSSLTDTEKDAYDWRAEGDPLLTVRDETFGYELGGEARFYHRRFILPEGESGRLLPFRVDLLLLPLTSATEERPILATGDGTREFFFGLTGEGAPFVSLTENDSTVKLAGSVPLFELGTPLELGFALRPAFGEISVEFFVGGTMVEEVTAPRIGEGTESGETEGRRSASPEPFEGPLGIEDFALPGPAAGTVLAGGAGLSYVVDELAVTKLEESVAEPPSRTVRLDPGESVVLAIPKNQSIARRYTVDEAAAGGAVLELEAVEGFRQLALLEAGETLLLTRVQGEATYILNDGDRLRLAPGTLRLRATPASEPLSLFIQDLSR